MVVEIFDQVRSVEQIRGVAPLRVQLAIVCAISTRMLPQTTRPGSMEICEVPQIEQS